MRPHRRQFVIAPQPVRVDAAWETIAIDGGLHLSYDAALPVARARDRNGGSWYLLGTAVQADPVSDSPLAEIASSRADVIDAVTSTWAGRWVLVGDRRIRTDAGALLGCFYGVDPDDQGLRVSSSPALIRDSVAAGRPAPRLSHGVGMDWYPPPASRFPGLRRLLPSQTLAVDDSRQPVHHHRLLRDRQARSSADALGHVETALRTALRNFAELGRPLFLGLTAGYDSRLLLAALWRERLPFTAFTWDVPNMSRADRVIPPLLADDAGVPFRFIERRTFDDDRLRALDEHTMLHTVDLDRELYPAGQYDDFPDDAVVLSTAMFEVGAAYYHRKLPPHPPDVAQAVASAFGLADVAGARAQHDGIAEWAEWIETHPEPNVDWRDRFYWEQRGAGWAASFLQGSDIATAETVTPANCESVLRAMLAIEPERRRGKRWEVELAYRLAPFATDHPYDLGGRLTSRGRRGASGWLHHPSKRRFTTGRVRSLARRWSE